MRVDIYIMDEVLVSVVIPAYNCEKYIDEALSSVMEQNIELECIIVDDHSTDGTYNVVAPYLEDKRFKYICNEENMGVAASRNKGVLLARGKYIAFLDGDDYWTADKLSKQYALMESKQAVLSSTGRELMDANGVLSGKIIGIPDRITYKKLLKSNVLNTSGVMVRRDVALRYPMVSDHLHEDYIMWLSILKEFECAYGINEPLLKYRVVKGSKSFNKIHSAKMNYGVYRYMGLSRLKSIYYLFFYAVNGVLKYM